MLWLTLLLSVVIVQAQYEVPDAKIEVLSPKGFRVSIPGLTYTAVEDEEGIKLFAFHGKINEELNGREGGTFSRDITKAKNGRWTFFEPYTKLKEGDVLYYWTYVDYFDGRNKLGYVKDDQEFVVKGVTNETPPEIDIRNNMKPEGKLLFSDEFSNDLQNTKWTVEQKYADSPDYEFVMYMDNSATLQIKSGILKIKPVLSEDVLGNGFVTSHNGYDFKDKCTGIPGSPLCRRRYDAGFFLPPVISSQISTKNKFSFKYGKVEIRAKLPKGDWIYPELYLNSVNEDYGPNYESGQIRIAFTPGNSELNKILKGGVILGSQNSARNYGLKTAQLHKNTWCDDFHKFVLVWKPDSISVSVDDNMYGNIYPPTGGFASLGPYLNITYPERWRRGSEIAPFDKEMYITLGVGVGGFNFEEKNDGSKPWKNGERLSMKKFYNAQNKWKNTWNENSALEIDYIKVWSL